MCILPACMSVHCVHAWCVWKPEEVMRFTGPECKEGVCCYVVIGIELRSSGRATSTLNYLAIASTPLIFPPTFLLPDLDFPVSVLEEGKVVCNAQY